MRLERNHKITVVVPDRTLNAFALRVARELGRYLRQDLTVDRLTPALPLLRTEKPDKRPRKKRQSGTPGPIVYRSVDTDFTIRANRISATRKLIKNMAREKKITVREMACKAEFKDFRKNKLGRLMAIYKNSPYAAVSEAFPELDIQRWEMNKVPDNFWDKKRNRAAAVRWMVTKEQETNSSFDINTFSTEHFKKYKLKKLLRKGRGIYKLLKEAGYNPNPWNMEYTKHSDKKTERIEAVRKTIENERIEPWQLSVEHLKRQGFRKLIRYSIYNLLVEAGYKVKPWEMTNAPQRFYKLKKNRVAAIRDTVDKLLESGRTLQSIKLSELYQLIRGVFPYYKGRAEGQLKAALKDAGYDV